MKHVRPFEWDNLGIGEAGPWLLGPGEDAGCTIRLRRGGGETKPTISQTVERIALVLRGAVKASPNSGDGSVSAGGVLFIPRGCAAAVEGASDAVWLEIEAETSAETGSGCIPVEIALDETKFQGTQFAYQSILDRTKGAKALKMNAMRVTPGGGSPDFHIHAFAQMYVIQEGEMTIDVGRKRMKAAANSIVYLPAGIVHRNFNASGSVERHVSLLVPEPKEDEIFDYAVDIHTREAELLTAPPP